MTLSPDSLRAIRKKHIPQRTCVGCRRVRPKREMVRVVRVAEGAEVDITGKKSGRGTYFCPNPACWEVGLKKKRLDYALRTQLTGEDRALLLEYVAKTVGPS